MKLLMFDRAIYRLATTSTAVARRTSSEHSTLLASFPCFSFAFRFDSMAMASLQHRTAPCRNLLGSGRCAFGARCRYSHDVNYAKSRPPPAKTPCFHWEEKGTCPYGTSCAYQHRKHSHLLSLDDGLSEEIAWFGRPESANSKEKLLEAHLEALASYDWLEAEHPTIAIPGMPTQAYIRNESSHEQAIPLDCRNDDFLSACNRTVSPFRTLTVMGRVVYHTLTDSSHLHRLAWLRIRIARSTTLISWEV